MGRIAIVLGSLVLLLAPAGAQLRAVQDDEVPEIGTGKLLLASRNLGDPNFAEAVVLIVDYDSEKGTSGLIINRRTKVPLSKVFPSLKLALTDPVYEGGPVEMTAAQALLRSRTKPENALHVVGDIYVTGSKDLIEKTVAAGPESSTFRLYVGYGGWGPGQLEHEVELGAWDVLNGKASLIFDGDPDTLWSRLEKTAHSRMVRNFRMRNPGGLNARINLQPGLPEQPR